MRRRSTPQAWSLRCRIVLACAQGALNKDVAAQLGSTPHAVGRWRARFGQYRIAGLGDLDKVHDIVGLCLDPSERALVFCVDEKSQIPCSPPRRRQPAR
ncbi:helix-turn-helix domain-containing protein [Streptomyces sp. NPDC001933]|uniref:helix-turn-helix domain-containing protein n=1 Tax=Streptomyces sp. NPDC001933 TaxID=3364626 RepID=UPI0036BDD0F1